MIADHEIHSGWGDHINWFDIKEFNDWDGKIKTFKIVGHLPKIPKIGETVKGEFKKSIIKFKIISVDRQCDPPDMFFAEVEPIEQELKLVV